MIQGREKNGVVPQDNHIDRLIIQKNVIKRIEILRRRSVKRGAVVLVVPLEMITKQNKEEEASYRSWNVEYIYLYFN